MGQDGVAAGLCSALAKYPGPSPALSALILDHATKLIEAMPSVVLDGRLTETMLSLAQLLGQSYQDELLECVIIFSAAADF